MPRLVISLTTIPPRLGRIGRTLRDLTRQSAQVDEIRLTLPRHYRRFGDLPAVPSLPDGITVHLVDTDLGPATKVLPAAQALRGTDSEILFCDDDHHYPRDWAQAFVAARAAHPDACITRIGYDFADRSAHFHAPVPDGPRPRATRTAPDLRPPWVKRLFGRRMPYAGSGYVQIVQGFGGAMLRPEMLPEAAQDIPAALWMVDDPWLSGQLASNNVPIWLTADPPWRPRAYGTADVDDLLNVTVGGQDRYASDAACVAWFQDRHGLWPGVRHTGSRRKSPGREMS